MRRWTTSPLRQRLTLVFAVGMAVMLAAFGVFVYLRTAADLLDTSRPASDSRAVNPGCRRSEGRACVRRRGFRADRAR